ncbi:MAG TPA: electron transfer flavoprotein subunit alpha, partial [Synergistaceae bacterium]|nr:electron transfer flavoprotein subunit alpha [Synergistaceae bacterium]
MTGSPDRGVWTLAEIRNGRVHEISGELLAWGRSLADSLGAPLVSVVPESVPDGDLDGLVAWGADVVIVLDSQEGTLPEDLLCPLLARLVRRHKPEIFIASAT